MLEQLLFFEKDLFFLLNGSDSVFLDHFFWLYSYKWTWLPFYACFLFVFIYKKNWKEIIFVLLAVTLVILLCDQIASGFFKPVFQRFRPTHHPDFQEHLDLVFGYKGGGRYGFISSHAANAFGFATFTSLLFRNKFFVVTMMIFAIINGYSRVYLGVHFISDVVVGSLVGILVGYVVYKGYNAARYYFLSMRKGDLKKSIYSLKQTYWLCGAYYIWVAIFMLFNTQLIDFIRN